MNSLMRNKRDLYLCERYVDEEYQVIKFKTPVKLTVDWQPISTDSQVLSLGTEYSKYIRIKGKISETSRFNYKDRVYVYEKPDFNNFNVMGEDADYEVINAPVNMLNDGEVLLKKLSGENE